MIRSSLAPNSKQVFIGLNGKNDIRWSTPNQHRRRKYVKTVGNASAPKVWLRLVRNGDTIIAIKSPTVKSGPASEPSPWISQRTATSA